MAKAVTRNDLELGKLETWLRENPNAPREQIKKAEKKIQLIQQEEQE